MTNDSSRLFLHRHPVMEMKCNVGIGHVIVDVQHWEAVLIYLHAHPDFRTELHNSSFGQLDSVELIPDQGSEIILEEKSLIE